MKRNRVAFHQVGIYEISTISLPRMYDKSYETIVFDPDDEVEHYRYNTLAEALMGHARMLERYIEKGLN